MQFTNSLSMEDLKKIFALLESKHIWKHKFLMFVYNGCGFWKVIHLLTFQAKLEQIWFFYLLCLHKRLPSNQSFHISFSYFHHCFLSVISAAVLITPNVVVYDNPWCLFTPSLLHRSIGHLCLCGRVSIGRGRFWRLSIDDRLVQRLLLRQRSDRQQCVPLVLLIHLKGVLSLDWDETLVRYTQHWSYLNRNIDSFGTCSD